MSDSCGPMLQLSHAAFGNTSTKTQLNEVISYSDQFQTKRANKATK